MRRSTARPARADRVVAALRGREWRGLWPGLLLLVGLAALDLAVGADVVLTGSFVVAPLVAAIVGGLWATIAVSVLALALSALSGVWNLNFGDTDYYLRLGLMVGAGGVAVFGAKARMEAAASMRRFELLNDIAEFADGSLALSETIERVTDVIVPELADFCLVDVISEGTATRAAVRVHGPRRAETEEWLARGGPSVPEHMLRPQSPASLEPVYRPRMPDEVLRRLAHDPDDFERMRSLGCRSSIVLPIVARGEQLGALTLVTAWSGRHYTREDVRFTRVLAGRVALAFDNAGLFSDLQSVERRMDTVMAIIDEAVVVHDSTGEVIYANEAAARSLGAESPEELTKVPAAKLRSEFDVYHEDGTPMPVDELPSRRALRGEDPEPTIIRSIDRETGREVWTEDRSRAIKGPDGRPLYAVTTLRDITEMKRAEFVQGMLARTGELLATSIDYRETMERVAQLAIPQLADWCFVSVRDDDGHLRQVARAHADPERLAVAKELGERYPAALDDPGRVAEVLRSGEARREQLTEEAIELAARDEEHLGLLRTIRPGSIMLLPMRVGGRIVGVLGLVNDRDRRPFDAFDQQLATEIAARAAVGAENARLATERSEIAEALQHGLLPPRLPEIPGWSAAALYRPAGGENRVGGDFYDAFEAEDGWMLVVGDVTGRGASAAALTALARYTIRAAGTLTGDPLEAIATLNRALVERDDVLLCSAAVLFLRTSGSPSAELVLAGHPAPLLVSAGSVREVGSHGPLLGAFEEPGWETLPLQLSPGNYLLMYTDGVTEARGKTERFGEARLRAGLMGVTNPSAAIARVERELDRFCAGEPQDDAAILAVMREQRIVGEEPGRTAAAGVP
jgi:PAS domain S-box-containing protein